MDDVIDLAHDIFLSAIQSGQASVYHMTNGGIGKAEAFMVRCLEMAEVACVAINKWEDEHDEA